MLPPMPMPALDREKEERRIFAYIFVHINVASAFFIREKRIASSS